MACLADRRSLEERVTVLASGEGVEELLGVPVSADGTGRPVVDKLDTLICSLSWLVAAVT